MSTLQRVVIQPGLLAVALALAAVTGCSTAAGGGDPASARDVLIDVLEAWKSGQKPDEATRLTGIVNGDPRWSAGYRLESYRIGDEGARAGFDHNFPVVLQLKDAKGKALAETVFFTVATRPVKTVIRAAFETPNSRGF